MIKPYLYTLIAFIFALIFTFSNMSNAQSAERFVSRAKAIDTINLKASLREITLWGIKPVKDKNVLVHVEARGLLDTLTAEGEISCKAIVESFPHMIARCISASGVDLGAALLSHGLVTVDRRQVIGDDFEVIYNEAEQSAREAKKGLWGYLEKKQDRDKINDFIYKYFTDSSILAVAATVFGTIFAIILIALLMLLRTINIQKEEIARIHYKEHLLNSKERSIIISLLKAELEENKHTLEAFIRLYKEMIDNVSHCDTDQEARDKIGKSIKKFPILSRDTFDQHLDRISFLNINVINKISALYANFTPEEEYIQIGSESGKEYIVNSLKSSLEKATNVLIDLDKNTYILDLEYVLALDSVSDYQNESKEE